MIPPIIDADILTKIIPTIISSIVILFYIFSILFGLGKKHRLMLWWRFLLVFLIIQQVNFIYTYYETFGHSGDNMCCKDYFNKAYVTFIQTLFGRQSIYYFGFFFTKTSYDLISTKYKKKRTASFIPHFVTLLVLFIDFGYVAINAYSNKMKIVESFVGRLLPSPTSFLFYLDLMVGFVPLVIIIRYYIMFSKRGFSAWINKKNFMSQRLMKQYSFNYYIPKKTIKFIINYLIIDQMDSVLTFVVHYLFMDHQEPGDGDILAYVITVIRYLNLIVFVIYPSVFVYKYIMKRKIDTMEIASIKESFMRKKKTRKRNNGMVQPQIDDNLLSSRSSTSEDTFSFDPKRVIEPIRTFQRAQSLRPDILLPLFDQNKIRKNSLKSPMIQQIEFLTQKKPINTEIASVIISLLMKREDIKRVGGTFNKLGNEYIIKKIAKRKDSSDSSQRDSDYNHLHNVFQHEIEHKEVYKVNMKKIRVSSLFEKDWENVESLAELNYFDGVAMSYFEGITPVNLLKREEIKQVISYLYSVLYINEPTLEFSDLSNIKIRNREIQIIEKTTKIYLIKRFLRDYYEYIFRNEGRTSLQNIRLLMSYTSSDCLYKNSFILLDHDIGMSPICSYQINSNQFFFLEWCAPEHKFIVTNNEISSLKQRHALSDQTRLEVVNMVGKDLGFLKLHHLKNYKICLNYYANDYTWNKLDGNVFESDRGNYLCQVVIRKFIPREILSVMSNSEQTSYDSEKYSEILLRNFEGFLGAVNNN